MTTSSLPGALRPVDPDEPCDRCGHASRYHARPIATKDRVSLGSECRVAVGPRVAGARAPLCLCNEFFPRAKLEEVR